MFKRDVGYKIRLVHVVLCLSITSLIGVHFVEGRLQGIFDKTNLCGKETLDFVKRRLSTNVQIHRSLLLLHHR